LTLPPPEYKPPSILAEHKGLAILFAAILIGFAGYGWKVSSTPARRAPPHIGHRSAPAATAPADGASSAQAAGAAQPIYVEAVPEKDSR
jgi:hypothetical protein